MNIKKIISKVKREGADAGNIKSAEDCGLKDIFTAEAEQNYIFYRIKTTKE